MNNKTGNLMMSCSVFIKALVFIILMTRETISAAPSIASLDATLNDLYENLLQREYAGPISFPNHQVERKAQRSPSLRLRFGRSDPDFIPAVEKRWFGDVNQKPIRSPSLRLRFGRRSDPMLSQNFDTFNDYGDESFDRQERKPSGRLRWGRSVPYENLQNELNEIENQHSRNEELSIGNESLRALLNALRELDENEINSREFNREIRKPAPLRLRWGRSTGGVNSSDNSKISTSLQQQSSTNGDNSSTAHQG